MSLILKETDTRLAVACRALEHAANLRGVTGGTDLTIEVELVPDFDDPIASGVDPALPERIKAIYRQSPASYRESLGTIRVNERTFFSYEPSTQAAVLAHELGHAAGHKLGAPNWRSDDDADLLACQLGYEKETRAQRVARYPRYAEALAKWRDPDAFRLAAARAHMQDKAGI